MANDKEEPTTFAELCAMREQDPDTLQLDTPVVVFGRDLEDGGGWWAWSGALTGRTATTFTVKGTTYSRATHGLLLESDNKAMQLRVRPTF